MSIRLIPTIARVYYRDVAQQGAHVHEATVDVARGEAGLDDLHRQLIVEVPEAQHLRKCKYCQGFPGHRVCKNAASPGLQLLLLKAASEAWPGSTVDTAS